MNIRECAFGHKVWKPCLPLENTFLRSNFQWCTCRESIYRTEACLSLRWDYKIVSIMVPNIASHPSCFPLFWDAPARWLARGKDLKIWTFAGISKYFQVWCSCGMHCVSLANSMICSSLGAGPMLQPTSIFYAFSCNLTAIILPLQK